MAEQDVEINVEHTEAQLSTNNRIRQIAWMVIGSITVFLLGLGAG